MIFTDEKGKEYEIVPLEDALKDNVGKYIGGRLVIKPPKWHVTTPAFDRDGSEISILLESPISEDQAQLIKEAISESMEWLNAKSDLVFPEWMWKRARTALKEDK